MLYAIQFEIQSQNAPIGIEIFQRVVEANSYTDAVALGEKAVSDYMAHSTTNCKLVNLKVAPTKSKLAALVHALSDESKVSAKEFFDEIEAEERKKVISELDQMLKQVKKTCKHQFKPLTQAQMKDKWYCDTAICLSCGESFGWRCKISPDGTCHTYVDSDFNVHLINGTKVQAPEESYNSGDCIFCGMPDERK